MKKILFFITVMIAIFAITSCSAIEWLLFPTATEEEIIAEKIGQSISGGEITVFEDSHGGFHGDGALYAEVKFPDSSFSDRVSLEWKPLPLGTELRIVCYGGTDKNGYSCAPHIRDVEGNARIPQIEDGYYYFIDNYTAERVADRYDESEFLYRSSFNYTLAIYDSDTKILYVFEYDT